MPTQRHPDRTKIQFWIWKEEKALLEAYAKKTGKTGPEIFQDFIAFITKKPGK